MFIFQSSRPLPGPARVEIREKANTIFEKHGISLESRGVFVANMKKTSETMDRIRLGAKTPGIGNPSPIKGPEKETERNARRTLFINQSLDALDSFLGTLAPGERGAFLEKYSGERLSGVLGFEIILNKFDYKFNKDDKAFWKEQFKIYGEAITSGEFMRLSKEDQVFKLEKKIMINIANHFSMGQKGSGIWLSLSLEDIEKCSSREELARVLGIGPFAEIYAGAVKPESIKIVELLAQFRPASFRSENWINPGAQLRSKYADGTVFLEENEKRRKEEEQNEQKYGKS